MLVFIAKHPQINQRFKLRFIAVRIFFLEIFVSNCDVVDAVLLENIGDWVNNVCVFLVNFRA